jgi:hypothetical protein
VHHYLADESNPEAERNLTLIPLTSEIEIKKKKKERGGMEKCSRTSRESSWKIICLS